MNKNKNLNRSFLRDCQKAILATSKMAGFFVEGWR
jgi:hypothetical protein